MMLCKILTPFVRTIKPILRTIYRNLYRIWSNVWDSRLRALCSVKESGKEIFKIYDFGTVTRSRASFFEKVEPETLRWINSFEKNDNFLDIGANVGVYSLYAASKGINVISIEPDALNNALLNLNIRINNYGDKIVPYSIAIHDIKKFSKFNISSMIWGGAMNSFDNSLNYQGKKYNPIHSQGVFGISLDEFINNLSSIPNHLKIDVDGNENLILKGAKKYLGNKSLKSLLIELDEVRTDYKNTIIFIESYGFELIEKTHSDHFPKTNYNHIFRR